MYDPPPVVRNSPPLCTVTWAVRVAPFAFNTAPLETTIVPLTEPLVTISVPVNVKRVGQIDPVQHQVRDGAALKTRPQQQRAAGQLQVGVRIRCQ